MLYAYTAHNLGDDLFVYTICQHYPNTTFFLYAPNRYKITYQSVSNLHIIPSDTILRRFIANGFQRLKRMYHPASKIAYSCDAGIYIGGSLFIEQKNWRKQLPYIYSMIKHHEKLFLIGANFGPFTTRTFLQHYKRIFQKFTALSFRDSYSKSLFDHPQNQQAEDLIFQLQTKESPIQKTDNIVISVIYPAIRADLKHMNHTYFTFIAQVTQKLIHEGYNITLMSFCKTENDPTAIKEIFTYIPKQFYVNITQYHYYTNIDEALKQIATAKAVIATRFHAMILGWLFQKPTYPIVYSQKMQYVIEEYQFKGKYAHIKELENVMIEDILESMEEAPFPIEACVESAKKHFEIIDVHMKKE